MEELRAVSWNKGAPSIQETEISPFAWWAWISSRIAAKFGLNVTVVSGDAQLLLVGVRRKKLDANSGRPDSKR
jgi:hypothetical protein